jgi:PleD family two-component response regulator
VPARTERVARSKSSNAGRGDRARTSHRGISYDAGGGLGGDTHMHRQTFGSDSDCVDSNHPVIDQTEIMNSEKKVNILMVDNEQSNLAALEAILECLNQNLIRATSGKDALRHILEEDFGVILLDVQMPDINGIEAAAIIRERELSRHISIIF